MNPLIFSSESFYDTKKMFIVGAIWDYRVYANFVESDEIHRVYDFLNFDRNEFYSSDPRSIKSDGSSRREELR